MTALVGQAYPSGPEEVIFGPQEGILSQAAFSPDGSRFAVWSPRGLEIAQRADLNRVVILPVSSLEHRRLGSIATLAWSRTQDILAFVLSDPSNARSELWTVRADGSAAHSILSASDGRLVVGSFVQE